MRILADSDLPAINGLVVAAAGLFAYWFSRLNRRSDSKWLWDNRRPLAKVDPERNQRSKDDVWRFTRWVWLATIAVGLVMAVAGLFV